MNHDPCSMHIGYLTAHTSIGCTPDGTALTSRSSTTHPCHGRPTRLTQIGACCVCDVIRGARGDVKPVAEYQNATAMSEPCSVPNGQWIGHRPAASMEHYPALYIP